jgi:protoporphyrinogen oxidase
MKRNVYVLGAGVSGIAAGYELKKKKIESVIIEKNNSWGGLVDNFKIDGFLFDKFIHLSFSKSKYVNDIFNKTKLFKHKPNGYNYYSGKWLKHPAQNNLFPLDDDEKKEILLGFKNRKYKNPSEINNYDDWLRLQYGDCFAEKFPIPYTRKYWTLDPKNLTTDWISNRMYIPSLEEVENGLKKETKENKFYTNEMRYPVKGGYKSFLDPMIKNLDFRFGQEINKIDVENKKIYTNDKEYSYEHLISSLPLTEICRLIKDIPKEILSASKKLKFTSAYLISLGFNKPNIPKHLWFYIYDKDIPTARIYSPSIKSPNNVPYGCSSFQAETYFNFDNNSKLELNQLLEENINKYIKMGLFKREDIIMKDIRIEKYANVIFDHNIHKNRKIIKDYLDSKNIVSVGRFGEWEYYWSDQSIVSGKEGAKKIISILEK